MQYLLLSLLFLALLIKSANIFVGQSISVAKKFNLSPFLIGFVIITFGTTLPELVSSVYSAYTNHPDLAISNIIGSNLANICLILGLIPVFYRYKLSPIDVKFNIPLAFIASSGFVISLFVNRNILTSSMGIIFLLLFVFILFAVNYENESIRIKSSTKFNIFILLLSIVLVFISGKLLVDNLISFSKLTGIAESNLGFFITAIGTSLPEFITILIAVRKGSTQIGIGNILGSSLYNLFVILGITSQIRHLDFTSYIYDLLIMCFAILMVFVFSKAGKKYYISRLEGLALVGIYLLFIVLQL